MFYYKLVEGAGDRVFINTKTWPNGVIESEDEITSPYVQEVEIKKEDAAAPADQSQASEEIK